MAPTRVTRAGIKAGLPKISTLPTFGGKRAAERSPPKKLPNKRAALGDVTNRNHNSNLIIDAGDLKKPVIDPVKKAKKPNKKQSKTAKSAVSTSQETGFSSQESSSTSSQESSSSSQESSVSSLSRSDSDKSELSLLISSQESSSSDSGVEKEKRKNEEEEEEEEDVYHDTVESLSPEPNNEEIDDSVLLLSVNAASSSSASGSGVSSSGSRSTTAMNERNNAKNEKQVGQVHIEDIDQENKHDPYMVPDYAQDIFNYYLEREAKFAVSDYMPTQTDISHSMRAIVVDWMVEVQENFELNHETLYMAIRLVDLYLSRQRVSRDKLQLVAATALFIACKFDERIPPVLDDFLYVCDDAYKREEYIKMEMMILKEIGFDIGMPSSYRFLRRYAKCGRIGLDTLTLARYILETSQMQYDYLFYKDSQLAAACLWLAMKMKRIGDWTPTLAYYSTYQSDDLKLLARKLNHMISLPPYKNLQTIKTKYSHKVFFEVAKTPGLSADSFV